LPHITPEGLESPLTRLDIRHHGTEFFLDGRRLDPLAEPVRLYHGVGGPGLLLSGVWIGAQRQYGVAVYREDKWLFSVTMDQADADAAYDQLDVLEPEE
jgi:hypothetical protein